MQRHLYQALLAWKTDQLRKPLILKGARQVGKTYLLKTFAQQEFVEYMYLNFESEPELKNLFQGSIKAKNLLEKISLYKEQAIKPLHTLLIFDEVQECPEALNSLKYFQEEANELHVIAAGSLLGVKLAQTKGFPVGKVDFLELYPLSFFEFLDAIGKNKLRIYLEELTTVQPIPEPFHSELLVILKKYMYVGGMPEAVAEYAKSQDLLRIRKIQNAILKSYDSDFAKHAPTNQIMKISQVWGSIPRQLAKENKKFVFTAVKESARGREFESAIQWLLEAGLILKACNITTPKLPLSGYGDTNAFKVFLLDVGLLAAMSDIPVKSVVAEIGIFNEFFGAFTENLVAQELSLRQQALYYWTSRGKAEVDFMIVYDLDIYPLEVKAGASQRKKSLIEYGKQFDPKLLLRASTMNFRKDGNVCNFPLYLISRLDNFLS